MLWQLIRNQSFQRWDSIAIINQGHGNMTARSVQIKKGDKINVGALTNLIKTVAANNRAGGWRKLKKS